MNFKHVMLGTLLLILAAQASSTCSSIALDGDHYRQAEQYDEFTVRLVAENKCDASTDYTVTVFSDLPVRLDASTFTLDHSAKALFASVKPGAADPGLYTVHFLMESKQDIAREEFVVKVYETEDPLLTAEAPAVIRIQETEEFDIEIAITNHDESVLNNIVAFIDEEGQDRNYAEELSSLQPGKTKTVTFNYAPRPKGDYTLNYTVTAGEYVFRGQATVSSLSDNYPVSSLITVTGHPEGYKISYTVKNVGADTLDGLFLTIEDAPTGWEIISPSQFTLTPRQATEVELIAKTGEQTDASVHVALYDDSALLAEDKLELAQARLRGTGLVSFGESFQMGLLVLLFAAKPKSSTSA
ncbi:hypothetical protein ACFLQ2_01700 [archaeon]